MERKSVFLLFEWSCLTVHLFQYKLVELLIWTNKSAFWWHFQTYSYGLHVLERNSGRFSWARHYISMIHNGSHPQLTNIKEYSIWVTWTAMNRCKPLWIVAKPLQHKYYEYILKDRSRKSSFFYRWQMFPRTVALSAIVCVMSDFCC